MGNAKRRGTYDERKARAIQRDRDRAAAFVAAQGRRPRADIPTPDQVRRQVNMAAIAGLAAALSAGDPGRRRR